MKTYTEEDLRKAFRAGALKGSHQSYFDPPLDEDEYIESLQEKPEQVETIPITYGMIRATVGWSRFCDVTGGNHYSINEWGHPDDGDIYRVTREQYDKLF